MMELAFLSPWIVFLFIGVLDWGFYAYSLISLENATRVGALYAGGQTAINSAVSSTTCSIIINEMSSLSNIGNVVTSCGASPLVVSTTQITGPDNFNAAKVTVTYTTPSMIPIPGLLAKQFTITRAIQMKMN